jgi:hypothetical protein
MRSRGWWRRWSSGRAGKPAGRRACRRAARRPSVSNLPLKRTAAAPDTSTSLAWIVEAAGTRRERHGRGPPGSSRRGCGSAPRGPGSRSGPSHR